MFLEKRPAQNTVITPSTPAESEAGEKVTTAQVRVTVYVTQDLKIGEDYNDLVEAEQDVNDFLDALLASAAIKPLKQGNVSVVAINSDEDSNDAKPIDTQHLGDDGSVVLNIPENLANIKIQVRVDKEILYLESKTPKDWRIARRFLIYLE
jgi:hypothetical protein